MSDTRAMTRAEIVRMRREQANVKRMQQAVKEATRPVPVAKAYVRPVRPAQNKKRFNIALHMPRLHLRTIQLPEISRPRVGWRLLSFVLVSVFGAMTYFALNRPELRVIGAQVTGNQMLSPADVDSAMSIVGQPVFALIPSQLETRLRIAYPEIASAYVNVSFPNTVSVHLIERKPLIRWEQAGGYTWIADDGVAFRPRGEMIGLISVVAGSAPPAIGSASDPTSPTPFITLDMVQALKGLAAHVPPGSVILYDSNLGFGWSDPRGWRAYFGSTSSDVELKMRVYESMVNSLTQRGIRPSLINVMYPTAPYYRMSQ